MKKILYSSWRIAVFVLFVFGCRQSEKKVLVEKESLATDVVLDSFFNTLHKKGMFNGAVAVKRKGRLILKKGYGTANFLTKAPFLPETAMEIASVSKQFTATAILLLQQDNKLRLDDNLQTYLGEDFPYGDIQIKDLINHTSGLPDYEAYFRKNWDTLKIVNNKDIITYFKKDKPSLISEPGKKYHYSNSGYILLAEIVYAITGKPLNVFLKERIFDEANMVATTFYDRDDIWTLPQYAPGYQLNLIECRYEKPENLPDKDYYYFLSGRLGPGRLSSSVEDLIKWDSILYTSQVLSDKGKRFAFKAYPAQEEVSDYGFGWHVVENNGETDAVFHTGSWAGNLSYIKRYLNDKSLIVILNNTASPYMKDIRKAVDKYLNGKPLIIPELKGVEVLKKEICALDISMLHDWYQSHSNISWDVDDLKSLSRQYNQLNDLTKVKLIDLLLDYIHRSNNQYL